MVEPRGWYSRGYLPHWDAGNKPQFLSWRLDDALPASVVDRMREEVAHFPTDKAKIEFAQRVEAYCDAGHGSCILNRPLAAAAAQRAPFTCDGDIAYLHSWVIMPNHVHALVTPAAGLTLGEVLQRLKGTSSREVNKVVRRRGRLWQPDYFDRLIRDEDHFYKVIRYIEWNPVKARLVSDPTAWRWSSASSDSRAELEHLRPEGRDPCAG